MYTEKIDIPNKYNFSVSEQLRTNTLITGQTGSGKSKLSMGICDLLQSLNWEIVVFDVVGNWRESSIRNIIKLKENQVNVMKVYDSVVFDMSALTIDSQKKLVDQFAEWIWNERIANPPDRPMLIVLEEVQNYVKVLNSSVAQNLFRLAMTGRNLKVVFYA
jgi:ABC-type dipeptide/oligopeptide/nickel transport system ATPase component